MTRDPTASTEDSNRRKPNRRRVLAAVGAATTGAGIAGTGITGATHEEDDGDLAGLQIATGDPCEWERTDDSHLPFDSDGYGGWGGHEFLETEPGLDHYPAVFAHGNTRDACDFREHAEYFIERGFKGDALWAITFGREGSTHDEMRNQLEDFVTKIREYTDVNKVQVLGHSLGVTGIRYWMDGLEKYPDRYDRVKTVVGLAGANHGTHTCGPNCEEGPGTARPCAFISHDCADTPGEPLYDLNTPDETPHNDAIDYHTLRGNADELFLVRPESPTLAGAENVEMTTDHDGVRTEEAAKSLAYEWLSTPLSPDARRQN